jgi:cysteine desulfurase
MSARAAIYLDANAGLPPLPEIRAAIGDVLPLLYNPSSGHEPGRKTRALIHRARQQIHRSLGDLLPGLEDSNWVLTSGGTEGLQGCIRAAQAASLTWISQPTEHQGSLALQTQSDLNLPVDHTGRVDVAAVSPFLDRLIDSGRLRGDTPFFVSLIWVNNETGVIQHQLPELCALLRSRGAILLLDAAQAWGKLEPVAHQQLRAQDIDFVVASGHKIGAFSGTGVLAFSSRGKKLLSTSPILAGSQQQGLRAGTENTLGVWSLGLAAELSDKLFSSIHEVRAELEQEIKTQIPGCRINGQGADRVCNTVNISIEGISTRSAPLTLQMDLRGFSVSAGSACSSGQTRPSHVLRALGHSEALAKASLRISLPPGFDRSQITPFVRTLAQVVESSRGPDRHE